MWWEGKQCEQRGKTGKKGLKRERILRNSKYTVTSPLGAPEQVIFPLLVISNLSERVHALCGGGGRDWEWSSGPREERAARLLPTEPSSLSTRNVLCPENSNSCHSQLLTQGPHCSGYCLIRSISLDRASSRETCVICASRGSALTAWSLTRLWSGFSFHAYVRLHFKTHETAVLPTPVTPVPGPGLPGSE